MRNDKTIEDEGNKPFYYDKDVRTNAILYVNTLMAYVNKEQLPQIYSSGYNYEQKIDGMDDLRLWAKNGLEQFGLERPNWILRAGEFEPSRL